MGAFQFKYKSINIKRFLAFASITAISLYIFGIGIKNIFRYNEHRHEFVSLKKQHQVQLYNHQSYQEQLSAMESPLFWEREARRRLSYIHPKEKVYKIHYKIQDSK